MAILKRENGLLLIHDPEIEAVVGMRSRNEEVIVYDVDGIGAMIYSSIDQLRILVYLPENDLSINATGNHSILGVVIDVQNAACMAVVRIHVQHFPDVPNL